MEVIRSDFSAYHIPIIFLTGRDDRESVMEVISKKPEGYILKSMKRDDILNMINNFFADRFLRK